MLRAQLITVACAGCSLTADPNLPISIPLRLNDASQYFIRARINGSDPLSCNVDSGGGDRLYLDRTRAEKMGIRPSSSGRSATAGDKATTQDQRASVTLEVAGVQIPNLVLLLQNRPYEEFSCVIGQTVFGDYIVEVDYQALALRLHARDSFRYIGPGEKLPIAIEDGNPFIEAVLITPNDKSFRARVAVDTGGGPATVLFSKRYADANELLQQGLAITPEPAYGIDGNQPRVVSAIAKAFSIGRSRMSEPSIQLWRVNAFGGSGGPDGLLCGGFLRRFRLFFDYAQRTLILEPTASL